MPTATVFIWYPRSADKGHAAMLIGEEYTDENYVSWWPTGIRQYLPVRARRDLERTLARDTAAYNREPDREYELGGLDLDAMVVEWARLRGHGGANADAHYELFTNNCALTVKSVLAAGIPPDAQGAPELRTLHWTPKDIAQWCSRYLAWHPGDGDKTKRATRSKWRSPVYTLIGMR